MAKESAIFIAPQISTDSALRIIGQKLEAMRAAAPLGFEVEIRPYKKHRTNQQNKLYWAVIENIMRFCIETGFRPQLIGVRPRFMNRELLGELVKAHFEIKSTSKLSTAEFGKFIDELQLMITEQSRGNYNPIIPDEQFLQQL